MYVYTGVSKDHTLSRYLYSVYCKNLYHYVSSSPSVSSSSSPSSPLSSSSPSSTPLLSNGVLCPPYPASNRDTLGSTFRL